MNPDVGETEPGAALSSCAEMAVRQIWALSPAIPDSGGPCQSKARVLLPSAGNIGFTCCSGYFCHEVQVTLQLQYPGWPAGGSPAEGKVMHGGKFLKHWKSKNITKTQIQCHSGGYFGGTLFAVLYQRQGPLLVVAVLLSSLEVSVNSRVTEYQLHFMGYGKYLAFLPWMCAVVTEINTSVHKLLL